MRHCEPIASNTTLGITLSGHSSITAAGKSSDLKPNSAN
ncbi:Uncharacterised protein [Bordetella pertussis]|nr:Uncharacterised protein [Bordetella pertussis]